LPWRESSLDGLGATVKVNQGKVRDARVLSLVSLSLSLFFFFFFPVLGFELRAYTLSHSTSPFL
jgi:hypothetical protein